MVDQVGLGYTLGRVKGILAPPLNITPPPEGVVFEPDVEVTMTDGTKLRSVAVGKK